MARPSGRTMIMAPPSPSRQGEPMDYRTIRNPYARKALQRRAAKSQLEPKPPRCPICNDWLTAEKRYAGYRCINPDHWQAAGLAMPKLEWPDDGL